MSAPRVEVVHMPWLLELFSGAGGSGWGYHLAGYKVVGVDIEPQPRYPFEHIVADALDIMDDLDFLRQFDAIHASPPCQAFTRLTALTPKTREYPNLIPQTREALQASGVPYVIENVMHSPLWQPVELCGCMFPELNVYRARVFETSWDVDPLPDHQPHVDPVCQLGRAPKPGERMYVAGNFAGVKEARKAMGIRWMTRDELSQAIPPAYTQWLGARLMETLKVFH